MCKGNYGKFKIKGWMYQIFLQMLNVRSGPATVRQPQALLKTLPTGFLRSLIAAQNTHEASQCDEI